eukprot:scaffold188_cov107-Isochrysis_galbana.AAC.10
MKPDHGSIKCSAYASNVQPTFADAAGESHVADAARLTSPAPGVAWLWLWGPSETARIYRPLRWMRMSAWRSPQWVR